MSFATSIMKSFLGPEAKRKAVVSSVAALGIAGIILLWVAIVPTEPNASLDGAAFRDREWNLYDDSGDVIANMMKMEDTGNRARGLSGRFNINDANTLSVTLTKPPRQYTFPLSEATLEGGRIHVAGQQPVDLRERMPHRRRLLLCLAAALIFCGGLTWLTSRTGLGVSLGEVLGLSATVFFALAVYTRFIFSLQVNGLSWWMRGTAFRHVNNGLAYTKGIDINSDSPAPLALGVLGGHHPPGLGLLLALIYGVTGASEQDLVIIWMVPLLFHLLGATSFYLLLRSVTGFAQALCGLAVYLLLPMSVFHGRVACHESPTMGLTMAGLFCCVTYLRKGGRRWLVASLVFMAWACCMGWPAYFYCAAMGVGALLYKEAPAARRKLYFFSVGTVSTFFCALVFLQHKILLGSIDALLHAASRRIGSGGFEEFKYETYTWMEWAGHVTEIAVKHTFGLPLIIGALIGVGVMLIHRFLRGWNARVWLLVVTTFVALLHMVLFHFGSWVHDYWTFYFIPPVAIALSSIPFDTLRYRPARVVLVLAMLGLLYYSMRTYLPGLGAL